MLLSTLFLTQLTYRDHNKSSTLRALNCIFFPAKDFSYHRTLYIYIGVLPHETTSKPTLKLCVTLSQWFHFLRKTDDVCETRICRKRRKIYAKSDAYVALRFLGVKRAKMHFALQLEMCISHGKATDQARINFSKRKEHGCDILAASLSNKLCTVYKPHLNTTFRQLYLYIGM